MNTSHTEKHTTSTGIPSLALPAKFVRVGLNIPTNLNHQHPASHRKLSL